MVLNTARMPLGTCVFWLRMSSMLGGCHPPKIIHAKKNGSVLHLFMGAQKVRVAQYHRDFISSLSRDLLSLCVVVVFSRGTRVNPRVNNTQISTFGSRQDESPKKDGFGKVRRRMVLQPHLKSHWKDSN